MSKDRQKTYKNRGRNITDLRNQRSEVTVELRRNRKEEALRKRRNIPEDAEDYQSPLGAGLTLESLVIKAQSSNQEEQFSAVQATRKILSKDKNPPIDEIIRTGIVPVLVSCLQSVRYA
ncbi:Importin subunit alpha-3 [Geodia barretti]|uniref:Importin subunit alpha-3 n=1 Tax=Geodia barretti TaxID=519541 RepID=A0AA35RC76_GEOBA|nr:Importin subunit alpha-3 [Geodia barretti]